jgi:hypothetical protein
MSDLLKEAIADAKAVRETALQNAKMALEEAFTPHLKSMLSAKLSEDDIEEGDYNYREEDDEEEKEEGMGDEMEREDDDGVDINIDADGEEDSPQEEDVDESTIIEIDGVKYAPIVSEEEHEDEEEMEEELDLESVIKELETEISEAEHDEDEDEDKVDEDIVTEIGHDKDDEEDKKDDVDEQSTSSGIGNGTSVKQGSAADEEDPGKGKIKESVDAMQNELNEYKEAVTYLRDKLHEVNILNAKLLFTNRLFKEFVLSNDQKMKIVETFDRAQTTREIKLVYSTLAESFNGNGQVSKTRGIKESASRKTNTTKPQTKIISEENVVANRFKKLAGILRD